MDMSTSAHTAQNNKHTQRRLTFYIIYCYDVVCVVVVVVVVVCVHEYCFSRLCMYYIYIVLY